MSKIDKLKVCFIGVGSIASRHIKNLREICNDEGIELSVHALRREKKDDYAGNLIDETYTDLESLSCDYDIIFITNPTQFHLKALRDIHNNGKNFFIEKPYVIPEMVNEARAFDYDSNKKYYVACPLRYKKIIQEAKRVADENNIIAVQAICSSYLPEWRPGVDYRTCYSANKALGGGVSIDLIHEWDYLQYIFGIPNEVISVKKKLSNLEIDTDDYASYIGNYDDKAIELHLDYFGREAIRKMTYYTTNDTIEFDLILNKIKYLKSKKIISYVEERDDFQKAEIRHFLKIIAGETDNTNMPEMACNTIELTQGVIRR